MCQYWKLAADVLQKLPIQSGQRDPRPPRQSVENQPPRIDQQTITEGFATIGVSSTLTSGDHIALIFNGPGAEQDFPVRRAGRGSESRRLRHDLHPLIGHR